MPRPCPNCCAEGKYCPVLSGTVPGRDLTYSLVGPNWGSRSGTLTYRDNYVNTDPPDARFVVGKPYWRSGCWITTNGAGIDILFRLLFDCSPVIESWNAADVDCAGSIIDDPGGDTFGPGGGYTLRVWHLDTLRSLSPLDVDYRYYDSYGAPTDNVVTITE